MYFNNIGWINEDIFYFKYTVGTKGFFTENLHGTKSNFIFATYIYDVLDFVSKTAFSLLITYLLFYKNKKELVINKYMFLLTTYFGLLLISIKIYDRYLLPILLFSILYLVSLKFLDYINIYFLVSWILLIILYSYNYSQDYIRTNNYVYNKAETLYITEKLEPQQITATDLWRYKYPNTSEPKIYKFTYDNPNLQNYSTDFELIDKKVIDYPLNFWLEKNVIYLYRKIDIN